MRKGVKYFSVFMLMLTSILLISLLPGSSGDINSKQPDSPEGVSYENIVCYSTTGDFEGRESPTGQGINEVIGCDHNIVFNLGLNETAGVNGVLFGGNTASVPFTNLTLCNASAGCGVPSDVASEGFTAFSAGCGVESVTGSVVDNGIGSVNLTNTFTATCDDLVTNVTRIQNNTGTNFAGNNFSLVTLQTSDQLSINYTITATSS